MKVLIVITLLGIVASLAQALFAMSSGPDDSGRVVRALTVRIALSVVLSRARLNYRPSSFSRSSAFFLFAAFAAGVCCCWRLFFAASACSRIACT